MSPKIKSQKVSPKRWVVERTFAWLGNFRRLAKDFEKLTKSAESLIRIAMIGLMLNKLKAGCFFMNTASHSYQSKDAYFYPYKYCKNKLFIFIYSLQLTHKSQFMQAAQGHVLLTRTPAWEQRGNLNEDHATWFTNLSEQGNISSFKITRIDKKEAILSIKKANATFINSLKNLSTDFNLQWEVTAPSGEIAHATKIRISFKMDKPDDQEAFIKILEITFKEPGLDRSFVDETKAFFNILSRKEIEDSCAEVERLYHDKKIEEALVLAKAYHQKGYDDVALKLIQVCGSCHDHYLIAKIRADFLHFTGNDQEEQHKKLARKILENVDGEFHPKYKQGIDAELERLQTALTHSIWGYDEETSLEIIGILGLSANADYQKTTVPLPSMCISVSPTEDKKSSASIEVDPAGCMQIAKLVHAYEEFISYLNPHAIKIQRTFRDYLTKQAIHKHTAATKIQSVFRGHLVRRNAAQEAHVEAGAAPDTPNA